MAEGAGAPVVYAHSCNAQGTRHGLVEHLRGVARLATATTLTPPAVRPLASGTRSPHGSVRGRLEADGKTVFTESQKYQGLSDRRADRSAAWRWSST